MTAFELQEQSGRTFKSILFGAAGLLGVFALVMWRRRSIDTRRLGPLWEAGRRTLAHPERIASSKGPFWTTLGRRVLLGSLSFAGVEIAKRMIKPAIQEATR